MGICVWVGIHPRISIKNISSKFLHSLPLLIVGNFVPMLLFLCYEKKNYYRDIQYINPHENYQFS